MKIRLVTVVWGDFFVDIFLRVTVRSLLAAGNAGDLARAHQVIYTIQTTPEDKAMLEASPHFQKLASVIQIDFQVFNPSELNPADLAQHWYFWRQIAAIARPNREILFFIIPDMLFGAGTLMRWAGFFEAGRYAVWTSVPQVVLETALDELEQRFPKDGEAVMSMDVSDVHQFFLRQMHPYMLTMFRDSERWLRHPEIVFKEIPGEGLAMRAMCSHLFCIDLNHFTITDAFSPVDNLEDIAYDQLSQGVCLERLMKHSDLYYRPKKMDQDRLSNLGRWLDDFCTPADMLESYHTYRFSGRQDAPRESVGFKRAAASLGFYACQVRLTGSIFRLVRGLREAGCQLGARILATAHHAARLRRHWRIKGEATLFVPSDASLEAATPSFRGLMAPGGEKALIDLMLGHVAPGKLGLSVGDRVVRHASGAVTRLSSAGGPDLYIAERGPGALIVGGPIEIDDCFIYVIDRPLTWPEAPAEPAPRPAMLANRWASSPRRVMTPVVLPVAPPSPPPPATLVRRIKGRLRRELEKARRFEGPARKGLAVLRLARRPRAFAARLKEALGWRVSLLRHKIRVRAESEIRRVIGGVYRRASALPVAGPVVRRVGAKALAVYEARMRPRRQTAVQTVLNLPTATGGSTADNQDLAASIAIKKDIPSPPSPEALAGLLDVQAAQTVLNLAGLLRFYHAKVSDLVPHYPPLAMVEECLNRSDITRERLSAEVRAVLDVHPDFAEAWLELGYLSRDLGRLSLAEQCWVECATSTDYLAVPVDRVGCKALAAFERGRALEQRGRLAAAAEAYGECSTRDVRVRLAFLANGRVLRQLGRIDEALVQYEAAMETDGATAPFGKLPRTFEGLGARLEVRFPKGEGVMSNPQISHTGASAESAA